jgi:hypothetical protein
MNRRQHLPLITLATISPAANAQFQIDWYTIDGGGGASSGGGFSLSGTIGQPDAGPSMTSGPGGPFSATGGFLARLLRGRGGVPPGHERRRPGQHPGFPGVPKPLRLRRPPRRHHWRYAGERPGFPGVSGAVRGRVLNESNHPSAARRPPRPIAHFIWHFARTASPANAWRLVPLATPAPPGAPAASATFGRRARASPPASRSRTSAPYLSIPSRPPHAGPPIDRSSKSHLLAPRLSPCLRVLRGESHFFHPRF